MISSGGWLSIVANTEGNEGLRRGQRHECGVEGFTDVSVESRVDKVDGNGVCNCRRKLSVLDNFRRQCLDLHGVEMRWYRKGVLNL